MKKHSSTLRLVYPQWQGGVVAHWMPELPAADASRGYWLGAQLLNMLAPQTGQRTVQVPVSTDIASRTVENGIMDYGIILEQTKAALAAVRIENPDRIVTLGGECSVSVVPFAYLAAKYPDDVAMVWIDAHPDINLPHDDYKGYHAMAVTALMGMGDAKITGLLPGRFDPSKVLVAGLRSWDAGMQARQKELGIKGLSPSEMAEDSTAVLDWIKGTGVSKAVVHFDLDALDPAEIIAGVGVEPGGMKIDETVRLINDIASHCDLVGLTIAEPMPRLAIRLRNMLAKMPLLE